MKLHITYCSKEKDRSRRDLPAIDRYQSNRIQQVYSQASEKEKKFAILSGKYGVLEPEDKIPFYDEMLREKDIPSLINEVENYLRSQGIEKVIYHTKKVHGEREPYFKLIKSACETLDIKFEKKLINQDI